MKRKLQLDVGILTRSLGESAGNKVRKPPLREEGSPKRKSCGGEWKALCLMAQQVPGLVICGGR